MLTQRQRSTPRLFARRKMGMQNEGEILARIWGMWREAEAWGQRTGEDGPLRSLARDVGEAVTGLAAWALAGGQALSGE